MQRGLPESDDLEGLLDKFKDVGLPCEYSHLCPESNYGSEDICLYAKEACKGYWDNRRAEFKLWYQIMMDEREG